MGNKAAKRPALRRMATFVAALGMLTMSSGIALMVSAGQASAAPPATVSVCHANNSDDNGNSPYNFLQLPLPGAAGHALTHRSGGVAVKHWSSDGTWNGTWHEAGDERPDYIEGLDGSFSQSWCEAAAHAPVTASVDWAEPVCGNQNTASWEGEGDNVTFSLTDGNPAPGASVEVTATADEGYHFAGGVKTKKFTHTYDAAEDCTAFDASADVQFTEPQCENENTASYTPTGINVTFEITDGSVAPGATVEITATATAGHAFDDESKTKVFTHTFDPVEICEIVLPPRELTPEAPTFVDPTCTTDPSMGLPEPVVVDVPEKARALAGPVIKTVDVDGIRYEASGSLVPGGTVDVVATLINPETSFFPEGADTAWSHTFTVPTGCTVVEPPTSSPVIVESPVVTPTVVSSGLAPDVQDLRGEQGLALLVTGMILMVLAGGLGLARPRRTHS